MSGGNYNVSCLQVLESEKKLKVLSLLNVISEKNGRFEISDFSFPDEQQSSVKEEIPETFYETFNSCDDEVTDSKTMSVLVFIAGYVSYKVCHKIPCKDCCNSLIKSTKLVLEYQDEPYFSKYLKLMDRGELKWPQEIVVFSVSTSFQIFQKLVSAKYEDVFLKYPGQKELLVTLVLDKLEMIGVPLTYVCLCKNNLKDLIRRCILCVSNIFLNNYSKMRNERRTVKGFKRKLETFSLK